MNVSIKLHYVAETNVCSQLPSQKLYSLIFRYIIIISQAMLKTEVVES